jgi:hypothetical protein
VCFIKDRIAFVGIDGALFSGRRAIALLAFAAERRKG